MKLAILFSLVAASSAFVAAPSQRVKSDLAAATTGGFKKDFGDYPLFKEKSLTPVATRKVTKAERAKMKDVVIPTSFDLVWAVAALGPLIAWYHPCTFSSFGFFDFECHFETPRLYSKHDCRLILLSPVHDASILQHTPWMELHP